MLCITLKPNATVQVGQATIINPMKHAIKIGITAPQLIPIIRSDAKCKERKST